MSALTARVDEIDVQMERMKRLIEGAQTIDRELAAGLGCNESMSGIQGHIDRAIGTVESLDRDLRKYLADRK